MKFSGFSIKWKILFLVLLGPVVIAVSLDWQRIDDIRSGVEKTIISKSAGIVLMAEAKESGYTFRAPKVKPRNPQNSTTNLEKDMLAELASKNLSKKTIQGSSLTFQSLKQAGDNPHV